MKKISFLILLVLLAGCGNIRSKSPTPVETGVPPSFRAVITPRNVSRLAEITQIGKGSTQQVLLSPDGSWLTVLTTKGIFFYKAENMELVREFPGSGIEFSPDSRYFSITTSGGSSLYDGKSLELIREFDLRKIIFNPNGGFVVAPLATDLTIYNGGASISKVISDWQKNIITNSDGSLLLTASDQNITLWDMQHLHPAATYHLDNAANPVEFLRNDQVVALEGVGFLGGCDGPSSGFTLFDLKEGHVIFERNNCVYWAAPIYRSFDKGARVIVAFPDFMDPSGKNRDARSYLAIIDLQTNRTREFFLTPDTSGDWMEDISRDGKILVMGDGQNTTFWDIGDRLEFDKTFSGIKAVSFSPDGAKFLAFTDQGRMEVHSIQTFEKLCGSDEELGTASVSYGADGKRAALWDRSFHEVLLWDLQECRLMQGISLPDFRFGLSFNSDGKFLALAGGPVPWVYDLDNKTLTTDRPGSIPDKIVWSVDFDPVEKNTLAVGGGVTSNSSGNEGFLYVWNMDSGKVIGPQETPEILINVLPTSNGNLITADLFGIPGVWSVNQALSSKKELRGYADPVAAPDGSWLAAISGPLSGERGVVIFDIASLKEIDEFPGESPMTSSWDGKYLAYNAVSEIKIRDVRQGELVMTIPLSGDSGLECKYPCKLAFNRSGDILAMDTDQQIVLWDIPGNHLLKVIRSQKPENLSFSPDGKWLATLNSDGTVSLWGIP